MKESKEDRFCRLAEARVNKIIKMLRLLGNCSMTENYSYEVAQVERIFTALQIELDKARLRYVQNGRKQNRFSLSAPEVKPIPDTVSAPHITISLPDKIRIRAVAYGSNEYPTIQIYMLDSDETAELICFAEYNPEHPGQELCVGVYQSDDDETKYYAPYRAERNQGELDGTENIC